jgi:hypothetical protein
MALGLSPPKHTVGMDCQLLGIIPYPDGHEIVAALNPVARDALISYPQEGLTTSLELAAEVVLGGNFTNDTKGRIIEKYILTVLEVSKRLSCQTRKTTTTGLSKNNPVQKRVEIVDVVHFSGNGLPLQHSFNRRNSTLFIPKSPNYPGLDFFIWNSSEEVIMAFQVTVKQPFTSHPKIDEANNNLWLDFCFGTSAKRSMEVYWMVPRICVGKPKKFNGRVVLLEELYDDFPALRKLTLQ